ncbi:hypothetical protein ACFFUB_10580 [Algimonas porphyrae]|uniref:HEAT repeat domain-containing protein n=1 Tax=Algimonas porphyrae TaxID=1128113 RepID=A0ABQ5V1L1_9PROT|nr:hypothetical protein [Algimonas porphyrae]GLQ21439.1 hypothetical protein GCM10007854_23940 [Algimonas porphyrae]
MRRTILILSVSLSALALGPSAFAGDKDQQAFDTKVENLKNLLEVAGRSGLVEMKERPETAPLKSADGPATTSKDLSADCMALAPLFDGGQGDFAAGLYTEIAKDDAALAPLARSLADLTDPSYAGGELEVDLENAGLCGPTFLPWQVLATPGRVLNADTEAALSNALAEMDAPLRRTVGMQIAIRAGMADNHRLARRVADTLSDARLHNQARHDSQPENVLLEGILRVARDPVGARARLSWVADRDGPEQFHAIDMLRKMDAISENREELTRLSDSPDPVLRTHARERLLAQSVEDGEIAQLAAVLQHPQQLGDDDSLKRDLSARLITTLQTGSAMDAVLSLDLIDRLRSQGLTIDAQLSKAAADRITAMARADSQTKTAEFTSPFNQRSAPDGLSGPDLETYLGELSEDLTTFQEVLARG